MAFFQNALDAILNFTATLLVAVGLVITPTNGGELKQVTPPLPQFATTTEDVESDVSFAVQTQTTQSVPSKEDDDQEGSDQPKIGERLPLPEIEIKVPEGWYRHDLDPSAVFITKRPFTDEIRGTEIFAYGPQMLFYNLFTNMSPSEWVENEKHVDSVRTVSTTTIDGYTLIRSEGNASGTGNDILYYTLPIREKAFRFYLYPLHNSADLAAFEQFVHDIVQKLSWQKYVSDPGFTLSTDDWNRYDFQADHPVQFQMEYPLSWSLKGTVFYDESDKKVGEFAPGAVALNSGQVCFDTRADSNSSRDGDGGTVEFISQENISLGDLEGVLRLEKNWLWYINAYCLQRGDRAVRITFYDRNGDAAERSLYDRIMSTISFVEL